MADRTDFYTKIHRSMFRRINEVGAKPFLLFQYYLTYSTAPRINPSSKTIALDLGILDKKGNPQISAVSHLKKELINAKWIEEINDEIKIIFDPEKTEKVEKISTQKLRKSQPPVEKISSLVEKISTPSLENLNPPYIRIENEQLEQSERTFEEEKTPTPRTAARKLSVDEAVGIMEDEPDLPEVPEITSKSIEIYREFYPAMYLDYEKLKYLAEHLAEVEEAIWRRNVSEWKVSKWNATNVVDMVKRYYRELKSWQREQNGNTNGTSIQKHQSYPTAKERKDNYAVAERNAKQQLRADVDRRRQELLSAGNDANRQ